VVRHPGSSNQLVRLNINYSDDFITGSDLDPDYTTQESFTKADLRLSLGAADGKWDVALIGNKLTD